MMKTFMKNLVGAALVVSAGGLAACAADDATASFGVGVSSYDDYDGYDYGARGDRDWDGIPNGFDRDRDGDGIPNRFDSRPSNPRWR
jgi:hypothetical protein